MRRAAGPPRRTADPTADDTAAEIEPLCRKLLGTRLWDEGERAWRVALPQLGGELLLVSQFTLHARLSKGTKPDFHRSSEWPRLRWMRLGSLLQ